jgi:Zn-finger nucleic acid-binding protein
MNKSMQCPKCQHPMNRLDVAMATAYRCEHCMGLWLTIGSHAKLENQAEKIDIGNAELGEHFNQIDDIDYPTCRQAMIKMVDAQQPHIWYESCQSCYGRFYDAGEYRDLAVYEFSDFLKRLSVVARE